jgi:hypothetical protein
MLDGLEPLQSRYNDVRHSLFRLVEGQRRDIADLALRCSEKGRAYLLAGGAKHVARHAIRRCVDDHLGHQAVFNRVCTIRCC